MQLAFNRTPLFVGKGIAKPTDNEIENTPTLRQASLDTAVRYGGTLTRRAIDAMAFTGARDHIVVDTKVHFLMPGWCPSIPGWHTDGVPRGPEGDPAGKGLPNIASQVGSDYRPPIFHLLVCGDASLTTFVGERGVALDVPDEPSRDLYAEITRQMLGRADLATFSAPEATVLTWDWWELHCAQWATHMGWRYLIRVTETDHIAPRTHLDEVMRMQNMVYVKGDEIGW